MAKLYGWKQTIFSVLIFEELFLLIGLSNALMLIFFLSGINLSIFLSTIDFIPIHFNANAPNILCPKCKEQDGSQPILSFIVNCPKSLIIELI